MIAIPLFKDIFDNMRDLYYKSGDGFLMVYSITDTSSLEDVKERYQSLLDATVSATENAITWCLISAICNMGLQVLFTYTASISNEMSFRSFFGNLANWQQYQNCGSYHRTLHLKHVSQCYLLATNAILIMIE